MKTKFKRLAIAALLLSSTSAAALADDTSAVGDLPGFGEEAYFHADGAYVSDEAVTDLDTGLFAGDEPMSVMDADSALPLPLATGHQSVTHYAPIGVEQLQPASFLGHLAGSECDACDGACDGGCDAACSSKKKRHVGRLLDLLESCDDCTWASTEFLLWFAQDRDMIPLVTVGAAGTDPTLPAGSVAFGGNIEGELSAGFRADYGRWISSNLGLGGRFWILTENEDSYTAAGNGTGISIARPFFNLALPGEDSVIVNNDGTGALAQFAGSVSASSSLDIWAGEAYARMKFSCDKNHRVEFLGGYSHFEIDDNLSITSTSIEAANGRTTTFSDRFDAENRFDGGQLGFEMILRRGKWTARSLTKVHLGNMNQRFVIAGTTTDRTPPGAANNFPVGMLARGNSGTFERDVFSFVPEANFKLAYQVRKNVQMSVGYSFIYWDNVALNGDVVDRLISDGATLQTGVVGARPAFAFDDSSLWVQGIDLGLSVNY